MTKLHKEIVQHARRLAALADKATPGPWKVHWGSRLMMRPSLGVVVTDKDDWDPRAPYDARLIAAAPEMAHLLSEMANVVEKLEEENRRLRAVADAVQEYVANVGCDYTSCEDADCTNCSFYKLREALAALEGEKW